MLEANPESLVFQVIAWTIVAGTAIVWAGYFGGYVGTLLVRGRGSRDRATAFILMWPFIAVGSVLAVIGIPLYWPG
ncbi:MAG: hypothetical protein GC199_06570 [Alphaproteobacteria bacterium]|nr:hypothetical protein [Alphaproteobacteria bacterium]